MSSSNHPETSVRYRFATVSDASILADLNHCLIQDEGHRNRMTVEQLTSRMTTFLSQEYQAMVIEIDESAIGYALFKAEPDWVYLRQFYVRPDFRRRGIGRAALAWLRTNVWSNLTRVRIDVLVGNSVGIAFWRSVGFSDYCLTMELDQVL